MEKLKIGLFVDNWYPHIDGVVMVVDNYAKRLSKFCDVTVFCPKDKGEMNKTFDYKIVQCKSIRVPFTDYRLPLASGRKFKKAIKESNLDIVHIHSPFGVGKAGVKYAKKNNLPLVGSMHSQFEQDFYRATHSKFITKNMLKKIMKVYNTCDKNYAVNKSVAKIYKTYGANDMPKVHRNATDFVPIVDENKAIDMVNKKFGIKEDEVVLLFVGRITNLKNVFFIVDALKILKDKFDNFKMIYVGDGPDMDELKLRIEKAGLTDKVILTGTIRDRDILSAIYLRAKLFLFPSMYDANSLVQIEASSQKTPTVFLEGSATSCAVTNEVNGYIVANDPNVYANKILDIVKNPDKYIEVANNAYKDLYVSWDESVKDMYDKYMLAISKKNNK